MQKQFEILNEICKTFYENLIKFDKIIYVYKFNPEENWVGTQVTIFLNGEKNSSGLSDEIKDSIDAKQAELNSAQAKVTEYEEKIKTLNNEISSTDSEISKVEKSIEENTTEIEKAKK